MMNDQIRPEWYGRLTDGPIPQAGPSNSTIQAIKESSTTIKPVRRKLKLSVTIVAAVLVMLIVGGIYGSLEVRRSAIHQAAIPGSAEWVDLRHAIENFRRYPAGQMHIQYVMPLNDGVLVFYQRFFKQNEMDISLEYMRKTIWGWKWIHGGGMGGSYSYKGNYLLGEYIPSPDKVLHTKTPFPIIYGTIVGKATNVLITGQNGFKIEATVFPSEGQKGWFAYLPESAGTSVSIKGISSDGQVVEEKSLVTNNYNVTTPGENTELGGRP